ncbi:hypothetical protein ACO1O0_005715 [Amphichorda felina]
MPDPPLRRRDHQPGLNRDYYAGGDLYDDPRHYASVSPPRSRRYEEPPPRRGKSERRRAPSPEYPHDPYEKPSRRHSRRADPRYDKPPPQVVHDGRRPRASSLTPPYAPSPPHADISSRRDRDRDREYRPRQSKRSSMPADGPTIDRHYPAELDPRSKRHPKEYRGEPDPYSRRRPRRSPPPMEHRPRGRDLDEPRPRARDYYPPPSRPDDRYDRHEPRPRRHRSQTRDMSPPPDRGRPPPAQAGRSHGSTARRNSMPASTRDRSGGGVGAAAAGAAAGAAAAKGNPWWKNPIVQAGARQAFTAGAQAAIRSKDDRGPWLGPKGAKVATAALSAALVDGFLGTKRPDGLERGVLRTGGDAALDEIDKRRRR